MVSPATGNTQRFSRRQLLQGACGLAGLALLSVVAPFAREAVAQTKPMRRRALLIGVSDYAQTNSAGQPVNGPYGNLSAAADIWAIKRVLLDRYGFKDSDIVVLISKSDTKKEVIRRAFQDLIAWAKGPEDIIYIHYSGHGDTLADGQTAALIPSDYKYAADEKQYDPNVITEVEVGEWLSALKAKAPGSVFLTFDCCHSGNITVRTRGKKVVTRTRDIEHYPKPLPLPKTVPSAAPSTGVSRGARRFANTNERGFFALSACRYDEEALETTDPVPMVDGQGKPVLGADGKPRLADMGRMSYALICALTNPRVQTYRGLMDAVVGSLSAQYGNRQTPQFDGDRDKTLFGSEYRTPEAYIPVLIRDERILLKAGQVHGMSVGSTFALYLEGTETFTNEKPFTEKAKVVAIDLLEAEITVDGIKANDKRLIGARAVEKEHIYDAGALHIELAEEVEKHTLAPALKAMLAGLEKERVVETQPSSKSTFSFQITHLPKKEKEKDKEEAPAGFALISLTDGQTMFLGESRWKANRIPDGTDPKEIVEAVEAGIKQQYKACLLRGLGNNERADSAIRLEVRLVPCEVIPVDARNPDNVKFKALLPIEKSRSQNDGVWTVNPTEPGKSDRFVVQVRNRGMTAAYVYVLDITSDGQVAALWPPTNRGNAFRVPGNTNEWVSVGPSPESPRTMRVTAPYGHEIIKVLATPEETDISLIVDDDAVRGGRGGGARGVETPLGRLLSMGASGTRSAGAYVPSSWDATAAGMKVVAGQ